ncbi:unnamed protein product [Blepharisma stoltei]|uniref:Uncharacterized protein n=1 Tax=Blepharisma stoltei TaxID=1481888 RepID=A0AAU9JGU3_9CILI|nr:unnamed protein product [Blepharisma stoltei]
MVTLSILLLLIATSFSYMRIPLNWLDKEELATAIPTTLPTTQLISESYFNNYLNKQYSIQIYAGSPPQLLMFKLAQDLLGFGFLRLNANFHATRLRIILILIAARLINI